MPPQAQQQQVEQQEQAQLELKGPKPQPFAVAEGQLKNIASAAFPALMRLGSGAFASGYKGEWAAGRGERAAACSIPSAHLLLHAATRKPLPACRPRRRLLLVQTAGSCASTGCRRAPTPCLRAAPVGAVSLVPDDGKYAVVSILGRKLRETSVVSSFKRPEQPIVLYEFEGVWPRRQPAWAPLMPPAGRAKQRRKGHAPTGWERVGCSWRQAPSAARP